MVILKKSFYFGEVSAVGAVGTACESAVSARTAGAAATLASAFLLAAVLCVAPLAATARAQNASNASERSGPKHSVREPVNFTVLPLDGEDAGNVVSTNGTNGTNATDSMVSEGDDSAAIPAAADSSAASSGGKPAHQDASETPDVSKAPDGTSERPASAPNSVPEERVDRVTTVLMESVAGGVAYTFRADRPVSGAKWFALKAAGKLVVDLPGKWTVFGPSVRRFESGPVRHAVLGEHPDFLRVVLVLRGRQGKVPAPRLESVPAGLRIVVPTR